MSDRQSVRTAGITETTPLAAADAAQLTDFARACKAAQRAVVLYPAAHPAITSTLGRIVQMTSPQSLGRPLRLTVLPDSLLLDDRPALRPDAAVIELATLLHSHLIGELTVHPGGDAEAWRTFLLLLARTPESIRNEGGIARAWTTMAGRHVELREIDYAEVLRERKDGQAAVWEQVVANCLQGTSFALGAAAVQELLDVALDADQLTGVMSTLDARAGSRGISAKTAALMRMLRSIIDAVSRTAPHQLEPVLRSMAGAVGSLSADMVLGLLSEPDDRSAAEQAPPLMTAIASHMSDRTIAKFVARNVVQESTATDRLALAFQTLVRDGEERQRLLTVARDDVASSPFGSTEGFDAAWDTIAKTLLTSYTDEGFVSDEYGRELAAARTQAVAVEQISDDPPERVVAWLSSVATTALRNLDLTLLTDILRIEPDDDRSGAMMAAVWRLLDDLLLVGDFEAAHAAVRRTAIHLLREFGGYDALPDLSELLNDNEHGVQREAVRAILDIGSDAAYRILEEALTTGSVQSREYIMQSLSLVRDERV